MYSDDYDRVYKEIEPVLNSMGLDLVELKVGRTKNLENVAVIIYKPGGVSLNDCSAFSQDIKSRLDSLEDFENLNLQVMSPGIERVIKDRTEYTVFKNKGVRILLKESDKWIGGVIENAVDGNLILKKGNAMIDIEINNIKKAKLDYTEEVENR